MNQDSQAGRGDRLGDRVRRAARVLSTSAGKPDDLAAAAIAQTCLSEAAATDPNGHFVAALTCLLRRLRQDGLPAETRPGAAADPVAGSWHAAAAARLGRLPLRDRAMVLLVLLEGLPPAEAAAVLGADPAGAERQLRRAVTALIGDTRAFPPEHRPRLLVVEDEAVAALEMREALEDLGLEVVGVAATAGQAVSQASLERPDLALVDIRLRGATDGVAATREIQGRIGIPAIVVTAYPDQRARAEAERPYGFLAKPWSEAGLQAAVGAALGRAALERHFPLAGPA